MIFIYVLDLYLCVLLYTKCDYIVDPKIDDICKFTLYNDKLTVKDR